MNILLLMVMKMFDTLHYLQFEFVNICVCFSADEIPIARLHGSELNIEYFRKHGFSAPIIVEKKDGLGLVVPPAQFTIQDVENYVGMVT